MVKESLIHRINNNNEFKSVYRMKPILKKKAWNKEED